MVESIRLEEGALSITSLIIRHVSNTELWRFDFDFSGLLNSRSPESLQFHEAQKLFLQLFLYFIASGGT